MSKRPRILIVEDELMIGLHLKLELEKMGYGVVGPVSTVEGAMAVMAQETIAAAVLDLQLHGELSLSVAQTMSDRGIPFIFVTGSRVGPMANSFQGVRILSKPVNFKKLATHLEEMCGAGASGASL
ncbi:MAG: response regulator [Henriciella sp.]